VQSTIRAHLALLFTHLWEAGLVTVSEIFDGALPHEPKGCMSKAWSVAVAGCGIKGGVSVGETDELGSAAVTDRFHVKNLHATILSLMGLDPDRLEHVVRTHRPALVYLIPAYQNPTGLIMPAGSRQRVAAIAAAYPDTLFVDDMTLAELPLRDGPRIPPLAAFGPDQPNLVSVGSLSKLYWGGLRTGWIRGSGGLIARLAAAKAAADQGSAAFGQAIVAALLRGQHEDIVKWRGEWPRARYDALAGAPRASLPGWTWAEPDGGLCLWARLPGEADSGAFAQAALRYGVAVVPGRLLSASAGASSFVRLAFTQPPDVLRSAVRTLAAIPAPSR